MPLSIPFLVYAFISGVSIRLLSMSGVVPAIISAIAIIGVCMWYGRNPVATPVANRHRTGNMASFKDAGPALMMPVIIVGGIWSGVFTPTEAAAVAVIYGLIISLFLYKDLKLSDIPSLLLGALQTSAAVLLVIGATDVCRG